MGELTSFPRPSDGPLLVVPPAPAWVRPARAAGWRVQRTHLPPRPWRQSGTLVVATGEWTASMVVLALTREAGVALGRVDPARLQAVLEDAERVGAGVWPRPAPEPATPSGVDGPTGRLLDALARGWQVGAAARDAHMSLRTAHRRLRAARDALGAATTAEAVARWAQRAPEPALGGR